MFPLLLGGVLIFLVGSLMVLAVAFAASTLWGVLCLLPPVQWLFALLNWNKTWDGLLMQLFGMAMALAFFAQSGEGFSMASMQQGWVQFQREHLGVVPAAGATDGVVVDGQPVQAVTAETTADGNVIQSVQGNAELTTVTVQAEPSKAVDDKPIYKCTDPQGNETWSAKPCKGSAGK